MFKFKVLHVFFYKVLEHVSIVLLDKLYNLEDFDKKVPNSSPLIIMTNEIYFYSPI